MRKIAVMNRKGGSAKTYTACGLAMMNKPNKTILIDTDEDTGESSTAVQWLDMVEAGSKELDHMEWSQYSLGNVPELITQMSNSEKDLVVVDTPANVDIENLVDLAGSVDCSVVVGGHGADIRSVVSTAKTLEQKTGKPILIAITKVDPRRMKSAMQVTATLQAQGFNVATDPTRYYAQIDDSRAYGWGFEELDSKVRKNGADDIKSLRRDIEKVIKNAAS